jgi:hypothetical protein
VTASPTTRATATRPRAARGTAGSPNGSIVPPYARLVAADGRGLAGGAVRVRQNGPLMADPMRFLSLGRGR